MVVGLVATALLSAASPQWRVRVPPGRPDDDENHSHSRRSEQEMGLFNKAKEAAQQAWAQQTGQPQGDGAVHVRGAGLIDPAVLGGPSTRSVSADDAIWEPINGISLQHYAELAREAQTRGVTDEAGMIAIAQERGWVPADTKAALDGWVQRMGQSMAVGQQFRKFLGY
jgi:hypothetical protein